MIQSGLSGDLTGHPGHFEGSKVKIALPDVNLFRSSAIQLIVCSERIIGCLFPHIDVLALKLVALLKSMNADR